jgi:hypothetical protein
MAMALPSMAAAIAVSMNSRNATRLRGVQIGCSLAISVCADTSQSSNDR